MASQQRCPDVCPPDQYCDFRVNLCESCADICHLVTPDLTECQSYCPDTYQRMYGQPYSVTQNPGGNVTTPIAESSEQRINYHVVISVCVVLAVTLLIILILVVVYRLKRRHKRRSKNGYSGEAHVGNNISIDDEQMCFSNLLSGDTDIPPSYRSSEENLHETTPFLKKVDSSTNTDSVTNKVAVVTRNAIPEENRESPSVVAFTNEGNTGNFISMQPSADGYLATTVSLPRQDNIINSDSISTPQQTRPKVPVGLHENLTVVSETKQTENPIVRYSPKLNSSETPGLSSILLDAEANKTEDSDEATGPQPPAFLRQNTPSSIVSQLSAELILDLQETSPDKDYRQNPLLENASEVQEETPEDREKIWKTILNMYDTVDGNMHVLPFIAGCMIGSDALMVYVKTGDDLPIETCYAKIRNTLSRDPLVEELLVVLPEPSATVVPANGSSLSLVTS